jgi:multidrug efflux pump subunit AcrB
VVVQMRGFKDREGFDSEEFRLRVQEALTQKYPGVVISVEKDPVGPSSGYPVNIEITGEDYDELMQLGTHIQAFINRKSIDGMEGIKLDVNKDKPALEVYVDRKKSGRPWCSSRSSSHADQTLSIRRKGRNLQRGQ